MREGARLLSFSCGLLYITNSIGLLLWSPDINQFTLQQLNYAPAKCGFCKRTFDDCMYILNRTAIE